MTLTCAGLGTLAKIRRLLSGTTGESGAEIVEFAFVAPLLITLVLGTFWVGRAYNVYATMTRAAREGVGYAVLPSCATCASANSYADSVAAEASGGGTQNSGCGAGTSGSEAFQNYIKPVLLASGMDPNNVQCYSEQAVWLQGTAGLQQCGMQISFAYPVQLTIPFTSLNASTLNISTSAQMRFENQSVDGSGNPTCP